MKDEFKTHQNRACGPGGVKCSCCNKFTGKDKPKLNRLARRRLKRDDTKNSNE